jgi:hypothetical protein
MGVASITPIGVRLGSDDTYAKEGTMNYPIPISTGEAAVELRPVVGR